jgi:uncharacterized protein YodC (DUF2158 family)
MKYKSGDVVIKTTGGNKMTIFDRVDNGVYKCLWFVESKMSESFFKEEEIVTLEEYKNYLKIEERDDKLGKLLNF